MRQTKLQVEAKKITGRFFSQSLLVFQRKSRINRLRYLIDLLKSRFQNTVKTKRRFIFSFQNLFSKILDYVKKRPNLKQSKKYLSKLKAVSDQFFTHDLGYLFFNRDLLRHVKNQRNSTFVTDTSSNHLATKIGQSRHEFDLSRLEIVQDNSHHVEILAFYEAQKKQLEPIITQYLEGKNRNRSRMTSPRSNLGTTARTNEQNLESMRQDTTTQALELAPFEGENKNYQDIPKKENQETLSRSRKNSQSVVASSQVNRRGEKWTRKSRISNQRFSKIEMKLSEEDMIAIIYTAIDFGNCLSKPQIYS